MMKNNTRREFLRQIGVGVAAVSVWPWHSGAVWAASPKKLNLLFLMTDEQRWDALGCAGNQHIHTPNLDQLARDGVRFTKAYSSCPVCSPARTTMLTGRSIGSHKITDNEKIRLDDQVPDFPSFDQILLRQGYRGEYHGKYHSPYKLALDYSEPVRWCNGPQPTGCKADMAEGLAFQAYLDRTVPARPLKSGELLANFYKRPYRPDPLDGAYGMTQAQVEQIGRGKKIQRSIRIGQGETYGCLDVPPEHTFTAWTVKDGLAALDRLKDGPFTLTISIGPPHPPMVLAKPYYDMYAPGSLPVPASINDMRANSPYVKIYNENPNPYRDPEKIRRMISDYYGLVTEVDDWLGRVLKKLKDLGLADNTLVIFTSDHGDMLGDHGMHSKMLFYEGAAHIPLLMRLPGVIPAGTVVQAPVAQIDFFATILDYLGQPGHPSEGRSLRPLIEGKEDGADRIAFSEWDSNDRPGFMVFDGRWKLMFGQTADAPSLDALYDLQIDPEEINNLLGSNPDWQKHRTEAERLKALLVTWLERIKSPHLDSVKARPIQAQTNIAPKKKRT